jgi:hypothetical protein
MAEYTRTINKAMAESRDHGVVGEPSCQYVKESTF